MNILLISSGFIVAFFIVLYYELRTERTIPRNKVHFYVARHNNGKLNVFLNKPSRNYTLMMWNQYDFSERGKGKYKWKATRIVEDDYFYDLGLNPDKFKDLKWEDEPVEVFLNLEN